MGKLLYLPCFISITAPYRNRQTVSATHRHGSTQRQETAEHKGEPWLRRPLAFRPSRRGGVLIHPPGSSPSWWPVLPSPQPAPPATLLKKAQNDYLTVCVGQNKEKKKKNRIFFLKAQGSLSVASHLVQFCAIYEDHFPFVYRGGNIFCVHVNLLVWVWCLCLLG